MNNSSFNMAQNGDKGWVSVIIPTYNRATFLLGALESVLMQSYRPIEIIVIDDGSYDGTKTIVERFAHMLNKDDLQLCYYHRQHAGVGAARNTALQHCRGEYIQYLDSDDILHPHKIRRQLAVLKDNNVDFVWSATLSFAQKLNWGEKPFTGRSLRASSPVDVVIAFIQNCLWQSVSGLHRRALCVRNGPWSEIDLFQDWLYYIQLLSNGPNICWVPGAFSAARRHNFGQVGDVWADGSGLDDALEVLNNTIEVSYPLCKNQYEWYHAIQARYLDIEQQAIQTHHGDIAHKADALRQKFEVQHAQVLLVEV